MLDPELIHLGEGEPTIDARHHPFVKSLSRKGVQVLEGVILLSLSAFAQKCGLRAVIWDAKLSVERNFGQCSATTQRPGYLVQEPPYRPHRNSNDH